MDQVDVYQVDPASVAHGHLIGLVLIGVTAMLAALLAIRFGWRSWWAILLSGIAVPTITTLAAGGALPGANWPLIDYISDVVMPLAVIGLSAAAVGSVIGAAIRWLLRRKTA